MMRFICRFACLLVLSGCFTTLLFRPSRAATTTGEKSQFGNDNDEAKAIHKAAITVDSHNDLPWQFRQKIFPSKRSTSPAVNRACTPIFLVCARRSRRPVWAAYVPASTGHTTVPYA